MAAEGDFSMKRVLMILPLLLIAGGAGAIERYDISKMTCEEVQAALQSEGKSILMSPSSRVPGMMRFDRYVAESQACGAPHWDQPTRAKTGDGQSCVVYRCISITRAMPHVGRPGPV
jgi:hypothetical protein